MSPFCQGQDFLQQFLSKQPIDAAEYHIDDIIITLHDTGILEVAPRVGASKDVVISAGIHGNETAPIELVNHLVTRILQEEVSVGNRVLFLLGNADAMNLGTRFVVHNLNRLFAGAHTAKGLAQGYELNRARRLETAVDHFFEHAVSSYPLHLDLHTAIRGSHRERFAIYPHSAKRQLESTGLATLAACQVNTLLVMEHAGNTFSSHTGLNWGAQSFTVELGRVAPFGGNDLDHYADVAAMLEALVTGDEVAGHAEQVEQFRVAEEIRHTGEGFALNLPASGYNFTRFAPGDWVWSDHGVQHCVGAHTQYLVFPNTDVPQGQRAGLLVEHL
jgi:succinylglutamate desuccinylase